MSRYISCLFLFFILKLQGISLPGETRSLRLSVRTKDSHSLKRGSTPLGTITANSHFPILIDDKEKYPCYTSIYLWKKNERAEIKP
jgi:hypothetical protein